MTGNYPHQMLARYHHLALNVITDGEIEAVHRGLVEEDWCPAHNEPCLFLTEDGFKQAYWAGLALDMQPPVP